MTLHQPNFFTTEITHHLNNNSCLLSLLQRAILQSELVSVLIAKWVKFQTQISVIHVFVYCIPTDEPSVFSLSFMRQLQSADYCQMMRCPNLALEQHSCWSKGLEKVWLPDLLCVFWTFHHTCHCYVLLLLCVAKQRNICKPSIYRNQAVFVRDFCISCFVTFDLWSGLG